jgi:5-methylcytosine-specific restriction endonuclease McrA
MAKSAKKEDPAHAARHCLTDMPYRMVVFERMNQDTPLYRVGGSARDALGAENALREALMIHGGNCFFCKKKVKLEDLSIDHAEPKAAGGREELQNLLITHKGCNLDKGHKAIESFHPEAGREWLSALLRQVQDRLNRI